MIYQYFIFTQKRKKIYLKNVFKVNNITKILKKNLVQGC
jgi:hypothetical protein